MNKKLIGHRACGCLRTFFDLLFSLEGKMKHLWFPSDLAGVKLLIAAVVAFPALLVTNASAADVTFPEGYKQGEHYASIVRGETREELFTTPEAIAAARRGEPLPDGTVITMEDYRQNKLYRYVVMEKRKGWGQAHPAELRTGDWEFQWFNPDRTVKSGESLDRCRACHTSQSGNDYVFSYDKMKEAN
ncbi:cytochrome P460 family protein [Pantoea endophytica]|uniref:cytochrome P460 family protein n=1 Tax=Pantoea endophytica TaxID=92488 RepID=UPI003018DFB1